MLKGVIMESSSRFMYLLIGLAWGFVNDMVSMTDMLLKEPSVVLRLL